MWDDVEVSLWVKISETNHIRYHVFPGGRVEFRVGETDGLTLDTDEPGLVHFIAHAEQALLALRDAIASDGEDCASE